MQEKYGWKLLGIERTGDDTFKYNCVFEGETQLPDYMDDNEE
jgi:hypothetical protein